MITMARLTRLLLVLGSVAGFSTANPAPSQAGVIPWVYDAIFGPVGSLRYGSGYGSTYAAGYPSYSAYSSFYAPMTTAYAPTMASAGGCSTCGQAANYPSTAYSSYYSDPYASYGGTGCNSCSSGNCSSGNCSNGGCASGNCSGSNTVGYPTPSPDRGYTSSDTSHRLNELEHTQRQILEFLKREYPDSFELKPSTTKKTYSGNDGVGAGDPIPARDPRPQNKSIQSESPYPDERGSDFEPPKKKRPAPVDVEKPTITPPSTTDEKADEAEPKTTRLDVQITRRAVAPRERISSSTAQNAGKVAKSNPDRAKAWLDSSLTGQLARQ